MDKDLPLEAHLDELRRRSIVWLIPLLILLVPLFLLTPHILPFIFQPVMKWGYAVYFYHIIDGIVLRIRLALLLDMTIVLPLILTQTVLFLWPGLWAKERKIVLVAICSASALFCAGVAVFVFFLTPLFVELWNAYGSTEGVILSGVRYYSIWQTAALVFGGICCLPAVIVLVMKLRKNWVED